MNVAQLASTGDLGSAELLLDSAVGPGQGLPVRATQLRHKQGLSTSAVLVDAADGAFVGWVQPASRRTWPRRATQSSAPSSAVCRCSADEKSLIGISYSAQVTQADWVA